MHRCLLALLAVIVMAAGSRADILPPGSKWVTHVAKFENAGDFKEYVFYVYPRDLDRGQAGNSSVRVPASGEVAISGFNPLAAHRGIFLFAVPRKLLDKDDAPPKEAWFTDKTEGVLKAGPLSHAVRSVSKDDKRERLVTTYKIEMKDGMKLSEVQAEPGAAKPEEQPQSYTVTMDGPRWHWILGGGFAGAALVTAVLLAVRRKV